MEIIHKFLMSYNFDTEYHDMNGLIEFLHTNPNKISEIRELLKYLKDCDKLNLYIEPYYILFDYTYGINFCFIENSNIKLFDYYKIYDHIKIEFETNDLILADLTKNPEYSSLIYSFKFKEVYCDSGISDLFQVHICLNTIDNIFVKNYKEIRNCNIILLDYDLYKDIELLLIFNRFPRLLIFSSGNYIDIEDKMKSLKYNTRFIKIEDGLEFLLCFNHPLNKKESNYTNIDLFINDFESKELKYTNIPDYYSKIVNYYYNTQKFNKGYEFCKFYIDTVYNKNSEPVDEKLVYEIMYKLSIFSFHVEKFKDGYESCEFILYNKNSPLCDRNLFINNICFYIKKLEVDFVKEYKIPVKNNFVASSPSLLSYNNKIYLNIRTVDYFLGKGSYIYFILPNKNEKTDHSSINYISELDDDYQIVSTKELIETHNIKPLYERIKGLEDIRFINNNEFFCTCLEYNNNIGIPQICYCKFDINTGFVNKIVPLNVLENPRTEKNWLPFENNNEIYFIYQYDPFEIYHFDRNTYKITLHKRLYLDSNKNYKHIRGSSPPIHYKNGWLIIVHEVNDLSPRKYLHRFIYFDKNFETHKMSKFFYFENPEIEFNLSMCKKFEHLLISYSVFDCSSKISGLNYHELEKLFHYEF